MISILKLIVAIDQDVVEIEHHKVAKNGPKDLVHQTHESARCISEAE